MEATMRVTGTRTKYVLAALMIAGTGVFAAGCGGSDSDQDAASEIQEQADVANEQTDLSQKSRCDNGVSAGPNTSCAFAINVAEAWKESGGTGDITVHSPTTGEDYTMSCAPDAEGTVCTGGDNASVYLTN
ncbi:MAG: hypothetical protein BGO23_00670 [Solirubrobacterales bacterium 67-14]|nr:MAG: hypothetical protein BGO23_00670 [Solirubrobacterales bacterium 67-14]